MTGSSDAPSVRIMPVTLLEPGPVFDLAKQISRPRRNHRGGLRKAWQCRDRPAVHEHQVRMTHSGTRSIDLQYLPYTTASCHCLSCAVQVGYDCRRPPCPFAFLRARCRPRGQVSDAWLRLGQSP